MLPRTLGDRLDELRAPLRIFQFITFVTTWPGVPASLVRETRFRRAIDFFEQRGRWPRPWEIRNLRIDVERQLGLQRAGPRAPEGNESEEEKSAKADEARRPHENALTADELATALDGQNPGLARLIEQFARLRRQTE